jgi:hypothetical protein
LSSPRSIRFTEFFSDVGRGVAIGGITFFGISVVLVVSEWGGVFAWRAEISKIHSVMDTLHDCSE